MPMTLVDAEREITALKALVVGLQRSNGTLTNRIAALEQASGSPPWERLLAAVNQYGDFHFGQLANQTLAPKPARPWKEV